MDEKKAFIFDTNFIIQNQQLDEVIDNLDESYSVYVTQVSIDERIAQNCRELKKQFRKTSALLQICGRIEMFAASTYEEIEKIERQVENMEIVVFPFCSAFGRTDIKGI